MRYYRDTECHEIISETKLRNEFNEHKQKEPDVYDCTFEEFLDNCMDIHNGTLCYIGHKPNYKTELHKHMHEDPMYKDYYNAHKGKCTVPFDKVVRSAIDYIFGDTFNPYMDKPYLDISWLKVDENVYLDLDSIWEAFTEEVDNY